MDWIEDLEVDAWRSMPSNGSPLPFLQLHDEILVNIFSFCDSQGLCILEQTCHRLSEKNSTLGDTLCDRGARDRCKRMGILKKSLYCRARNASWKQQLHRVTVASYKLQRQPIHMTDLDLKGPASPCFSGDSILVAEYTNAAVVEIIFDPSQTEADTTSEAPESNTTTNNNNNDDDNNNNNHDGSHGYSPDTNLNNNTNNTNAYPYSEGPTRRTTPPAYTPPSTPPFTSTSEDVHNNNNHDDDNTNNAQTKNHAFRVKRRIEMRGPRCTTGSVAVSKDLKSVAVAIQRHVNAETGYHGVRMFNNTDDFQQSLSIGVHDGTDESKMMFPCCVRFLNDQPAANFQDVGTSSHPYSTAPPTHRHPNATRQTSQPSQPQSQRPLIAICEFNKIRLQIRYADTGEVHSIIELGTGPISDIGELANGDLLLVEYGEQRLIHISNPTNPQTRVVRAYDTAYVLHTPVGCTFADRHDTAVVVDGLQQALIFIPNVLGQINSGRGITIAPTAVDFVSGERFQPKGELRVTQQEEDWSWINIVCHPTNGDIVVADACHNRLFLL